MPCLCIYIYIIYICVYVHIVCEHFLLYTYTHLSSQQCTVANMCESHMDSPSSATFECTTQIDSSWKQFSFTLNAAVQCCPCVFVNWRGYCLCMCYIRFQPEIIRRNDGHRCILPFNVSEAWLLSLSGNGSWMSPLSHQGSGYVGIMMDHDLIPVGNHSCTHIYICILHIYI